MITIENFRQMALSLPDAVEQPHFDIPSFRVKGKIFATLWVKEKRAMLKLSPVDQSVFCSYDKTVFFPVPNAWGKQGATFVELGKVKKAMLQDALSVAYNGVIKPKPRSKRA